jgi:3-methyladenine DNA glycosylase AlkD
MPELVDAVRQELRALADPAKAEPMRAYMKSEMPYLGVAMPLHRQACKRLFRLHRPPTFEVWRDTALALWRPAEYREERYCAINLVNDPLFESFRDREALPLYREMIVTGAWWDLVDAVAPYRLGALLERYPRGMATTMRQWAAGRDIWKRRAAIISQLKRKQATDVELLFDTMEPSLAEREFFLRKAIGWALREHAKTDPAVVIDYVETNRARLSPLSRREALRNVLSAAELKRFMDD